MNYVFTGYAPRFYPDIIGESGSLIAEPGDVREFDEAPADGLWAPTDASVTIPGPRTWPVKAEVQPEPEPEIPAEPSAGDAVNTNGWPSLDIALPAVVPNTQEN